MCRRKIFLAQKLVSLCLILVVLLSACYSKGGSGESHSINNDTVTLRFEIGSLNNETVTLINSGNVNVCSLGSLNIPSALSVLLSLDFDSTCSSAVFPLLPGEQWTYHFVTHGDSTLPGIASGTIALPLKFADSTTGRVNLSATVTNYLYAANASGVYQWDGSTWSATGRGPEQVRTLVSVADKAATGAAVLYAGSHTGTNV